MDNQDKVRRWIQTELFNNYIDDEQLEQILEDELIYGKSKYTVNKSGNVKRLSPLSEWYIEYNKDNIQSLTNYSRAIEHYNILKSINNIENKEMFDNWYKEIYPDNYEVVIKKRNKLE